MIRLMLRLRCGAGHDGQRMRAVAGRARQLSGQHHPDLRQLPHAARAGRRVRHGQAALRRPADLGRAALQGQGRQHHAGQGHRHRRLERRRDQDGAARRRAPERHADRADHAVRLLQDLHAGAISTRSSPICKSVPPVSNKVPPPVYKAAMHATGPPGAEKPLTAGRPERSGQARLLSRHHRPLHGVPHADDARRQARLRQSLGKGGQEFPGPWGVSVSRNITSHKTKGIGAWTDAEIKTRDHPGQAQGRHAAQAADGLSALCQDDRRRPRRRGGLSADGAAEGIAAFGPAVRRGGTAAAPFNCRCAGPISRSRRRNLSSCRIA